MNMQLNNSRPSIFEEVMPGWNGSESIMGYVIRKQKERLAAKEAKRLRIRRALILLNLVGWPAAALATVALTQAFLTLGQ